MQVAYKELDALVVNIGNQTKLFSTAVFCYLILGQSRTTRQVLALILICFGCTLGCLDEGSLHSVVDSPSGAKASNFLGLMSLGAASMLSGLSAALSERSLRVHQRNIYLFSMELCLISLVSVLVASAASALTSSRGSEVAIAGFFEGWSLAVVLPAVIPVGSQAFGGILVGRVTKSHGSVAKCFAVILGIVLTGILRGLLTEDTLSVQMVLSAICVILGITLHQVGGSKVAEPASVVNGHAKNPFNGKANAPKRD
jgi:UDP-sugar transporter A1/2/3